MNWPAVLFTASQLAAALQVERARAYELLQPVKQYAAERAVNGIRVTCWPVSKLPVRIAAKLRQIVARKGYCSIEHLFSTPPERWQPANPLGALADHAVATAETRRAVLAPVLGAVDAQVVTTAELVRRAEKGFAGSGEDGEGGDRTIRRWIDAAMNRDRGLWEWQRLEIYLDEKPPLKSVESQTHERLCDEGGNALAAALCSIQGQADPSEDRKARVWDEAFRRFESLVAGGVAETMAKKAVLRVLTADGIALLAPASAARSMAWKRQHEKWLKGGREADALMDRRAFNVKEDKFRLTPEETAALRDWRIKKGSLNQALRFFVEDSACSTETRILIEQGWDYAARRKRPANWPLSLRCAAEATIEEKAKFRGQKTLQNYELITHRGMWYLGPDGERLQMRPNVVWESDDMSSNEPFSYLDPESGQILIGRQTLCTQDVFARAWLSVMPVGRARDAYRVEDIADHFLETVAVNGLPFMWRVEGGVWDNNLINGILLPTGQRWGGLGALFHVERTFKSRGKGGIESSFNFLQSFLAHDSLSIGRKRGEFEEGTRAMMKAKSGDERAALKFWSMGQFANAIQAAMKKFNATPKQRRAFGRDTVIPDELYRGAERKECPEGELWRFCPIKKLATVRNGLVTVSVPYYPRPFCFRTNGEAGGPYFEHGYAVLIAFHPGHPERGCHIFNAERGASNRDRLKFGEFMLLAPLAEEVGQFGGAETDRELQARKRANAAVSQQFRSIVAGGAARISVIRDSHGRSVRYEEGAAQPSPMRGDSIKEQRAAKRRKEAEEYEQKAKAAAVDADALNDRVRRNEEALVAEGRAYRNDDGSLQYLA